MNEGKTFHDLLDNFKALYNKKSFKEEFIVNRFTKNPLHSDDEG
jgi:hypothetical protein